MPVQLVGPILRFAADRSIQLDGFESIILAILVDKTTHERSLFISRAMWIAHRPTCLLAIWRIGLRRRFRVLEPGLLLKLPMVFHSIVVDLVTRSINEKSQRADQQQSRFHAFGNCRIGDG